MTDTPPADPYRELREAAEAAIDAPNDTIPRRRWYDYWEAAKPATILALLAERDRLEEAVAYGSIGIHAHREREAELEERVRKGEERAAKAEDKFKRELLRAAKATKERTDLLNEIFTMQRDHTARTTLAKKTSDG